MEGNISKEVEKYRLFTFNELKQQLDEVGMMSDEEVDSNGLHEKSGGDGWTEENRIDVPQEGEEVESVRDFKSDQEEE